VHVFLSHMCYLCAG